MPPCAPRAIEIPRRGVGMPVISHLPLHATDDLPSATEISSVPKCSVRERPRYVNAVRTVRSDQLVDFPLNGSSVCQIGANSLQHALLCAPGQAGIVAGRGRGHDERKHFIICLTDSTRTSL